MLHPGPKLFSSDRAGVKVCEGKEALGNPPFIIYLKYVFMG